MKTPPSALIAHRATTEIEDAQELQAWQAILADERFGLWRAISVAGEVFLVESSRRWAKRVTLIWLALYTLPVLGSLAYGISERLDAIYILGALAAGGLFLTELAIFVLCALLWPWFINQALTLKRAPMTYELPQRRLALTLLKQRQYRRSPSLKQAFKHGFGPGVVIVAPLAFLCAGLLSFIASSLAGFHPLAILLSLLGSVFIFGAFFLIGLLLFGGGGLVIVGKQALDHRASVKLLQTIDEQPGALALAQEEPLDAGALSLSPDRGAITDTEHQR